MFWMVELFLGWQSDAWMHSGILLWVLSSILLQLLKQGLWGAILKLQLLLWTLFSSYAKKIGHHVVIDNNQYHWCQRVFQRKKIVEYDSWLTWRITSIDGKVARRLLSFYWSYDIQMNLWMVWLDSPLQDLSNGISHLVKLFLDEKIGKFEGDSGKKGKNTKIVKSCASSDQIHVFVSNQW